MTFRPVGSARWEKAARAAAVLALDQVEPQKKAAAHRPQAELAPAWKQSSASAAVTLIKICAAASRTTPKAASLQKTVTDHSHNTVANVRMATRTVPTGPVSIRFARWLPVSQVGCVDPMQFPMIVRAASSAISREG